MVGLYKNGTAVNNFELYVRRFLGVFLLFLGVMIFPKLVFSAQKYDSECIQKALEVQPPETTLEQIREQCLKSSVQTEGAEGAEDKAALSSRLEAEKRTKYSPFSILPYRPNYVLFGSYNFSGANEKPFRGVGLTGDESFEPYEVKFQISLKIPIADELLGWGDHLFVGYTNRSFWQAYNSKISKPFRETNHEPEVWMSFDNKWTIAGWRNRLIDLGLVHQSNGRSGTLSRSWDRAYLRMIFEKDNSAFAIKPWLRFPEPSGQDDNPDIAHYMGNAEFRFVTKQNRHQFSVMVRNNFDENDNKGALELGYSFPIHRNLNAYVQWFYGYGESLIDYDYKNNTVSIGVKLGNWL